LSPAKKSSRGSAQRTSLRHVMHRSLIAAEAVLVLGVAKDWIWRQVMASTLPGWGKVALSMLTTVGLFGGLFLVVRRMAVRGVWKTHHAAQGMPVFLPTLLLHAALLAVLFVLYARILGIRIFG
jgi:hypothetical protein